MSNNTFYTVGQLNKMIKNTLEKDPVYKDVWVKGEISNLTKHGSGHYYFSIKDNSSVIKAIMFNSHNSKLKFNVENGLKVLARAKVSVYDPQGTYQLNVTEMQPDGVGNLHLAFEQLKEKLSKEGLLDPSIKKPIPLYPKVIGIITSPTGAAVQDMITTIQRRYPIAKIQLFPVLVQGENSANSVVNAIQKMNELNQADVLIVGRGGGSIEDLWSFNEEVVARAIVNSEIPIISAVGHETDFTIADFVADMRAPTPTAAAEIATKITINDLIIKIGNLENGLKSSLVNKLNFAQERLKRNQQLLNYHHPIKKIEESSQKVDLLVNRIINVMNNKVNNSKNTLNRFDELLKINMSNLLKTKENNLMVLISKLDSLSPLKTLNRGYSVALKSDDSLIKSFEDVSIGDDVKIKLEKGTIKTTVVDIEEE